VLLAGYHARGFVPLAVWVDDNEGEGISKESYLASMWMMSSSMQKLGFELLTTASRPNVAR